MVKTKHQKSKPKKTHQIKNQGKEADISKFRSQLDVLGLKIINVTADGNCFFRAIADQLEGDEEEHVKYRSMVVQYIMKNREMFEPFIEDDVPFEKYCRSMEDDGTWAGHMELQAASLVMHSNICIHRSMSPRWYIRNFGGSNIRMVHLSYHDGEHYNSVRSKEDSCTGPARPITIKADADISVKSHQAKASENKVNWKAGRNNVEDGSVRLVIAGTGCENVGKIEQVLRDVDGDVDAAIEFLVAEQGTEECSARPGSPTNDRVDSPCNFRNEDDNNYEQEKETCKEDTSRKGKTNIAGESDKISRNQLCPCNSKKKYKACCGSVTGKASNKLIVNPTIDSKKGKTERKLSKRGVDVKTSISSSARVSDGGPPDMGALCI